MEDKSMEQFESNLVNFDKCPICAAEILSEGNLLHVWNIKYRCGTEIYGAIDVKTYGHEVVIVKRCDNENN